MRKKHISKGGLRFAGAEAPYKENPTILPVRIPANPFSLRFGPHVVLATLPMQRSLATYKIALASRKAVGLRRDAATSCHKVAVEARTVAEEQTQGRPKGCLSSRAGLPLHTK